MSTIDSPPRVLLLSNESPHTGGAGAIVMYRLLREYPKDRLLVVTNGLPPSGSRRLDCRYEFLPLAADRLNRTRLAHWRPILRSLGASSLIGLGKVGHALHGYSADVVVTLMQDSWYYDLARRFARANDLPLILLVHDVAHGFEVVPSWLKHRQLQRDCRVYRDAIARLCISEPMAAYYRQLFAVDGEVLLPPHEDKLVAQMPEECRRLKHPERLTLGYAGGLHYGYGEQLVNMLPLLRETGTVVEMFGPVPGGSVSALRSATDVLHFNGYMPPEEAWRRIIERCDAVLQPYLDPPMDHELQYRTHFPSKLGDCLALGVPLLITGPDYASGVAWCRERPGIAFWAGEHGDGSLREALRRFREEPCLRVNLATKAQTASKAFASAPLCQQFMATLVDAASHKPIATTTRILI